MSEIYLRVHAMLCEAWGSFRPIFPHEESKIKIQKTDILISHRWNWMEVGNEIFWEDASQESFKEWRVSLDLHFNLNKLVSVGKKQWKDIWVGQQSTGGQLE